MNELLLLQGKTVDEWRAAARTTHAAHLERLLQQAESYQSWLPPAEHPRETITYIGMAVANQALAFLLTENGRYLDGARRWIDVAIGYPHWGCANLPDHDLDAGWLSFGLGLAHSWIGPALPVEERERLRAKLLLQGQRLYTFAVNGEGNWWGAAYWQNHNWICYAGLAAAAFALRQEHPETEDWAARATENFRTVFALLPEDGSDYEGVVYWCYGVPWLFIAADLLQQHAGADFHDNDFLRNTFYYRLYTSAPNLIDTANFGDCHDRRSAHSRSLYERVAAVYRNAHARWLVDHFDRIGEWDREGREGLLRPGQLPHAFLELLWHDPSVVPVSIHELPLTRAFPDLGLVTTRTGWDPDSTFLAFKSSPPSGHKGWVLGHALQRTTGHKTVKAGHAHPDENSFILVRGGAYLAVDEGYSKAKLSRHHSTVLVDDHGQYAEGSYNVFDGLGLAWGGRLEDAFDAWGVFYARGEAAPAYDPDLGVQRFRRQMVLLDGRYLVFCDDLAAREPRSWTWLLQIDAPATRRGDDVFVVQVEQGGLGVQVLAPRQPRAEMWEQEIVAYPSSSTPEWVLRHVQHTLALAPTRSTQERFLVLLSIDEQRAAPAVHLECMDGDAFAIPTATGRHVIGFARDCRGVRAPGIEADVRWLALDQADDGTPRQLALGEALQLWLDGQLWFEAAEPVNAAWEDDTWRVTAVRPTWISLRAARSPHAITLNGDTVAAPYIPDPPMIRLQVPCGANLIHIEEEK
ncbi:MAG TPA: DUF4962 domain-containing protein [Herpetosiphonaceae bacterium]|nr:DUF4962 domain-containing protein [Herpetosiphonaceae bacterium]